MLPAQGRLAALCLLVVMAVSGGPAGANGLALGPMASDEACQRLCDELVFDCRWATYSPASGLCLVWDGRGWEAPGGLAVSAPAEADCAAISQQLGRAFWWDADAGACRQGTRDLVCAPADWAGRWNTTYETMTLAVDGVRVTGAYRLDSGLDYRVRGELLVGDPCVLIGDWDHLDGDTGPLRFEMTGPDRFAGTWSSGPLPPTATSPRNWHGTRD